MVEREISAHAVVKVTILQRIRSVKESEELDLIQQPVRLPKRIQTSSFRETNVMSTKSKLNLFEFTRNQRFCIQLLAQETMLTCCIISKTTNNANPFNLN
jgi:hypothetical protein